MRGCGLRATSADCALVLQRSEEDRLGASGPRFSFPFELDPQATRKRPHRGYSAVRTSGNNFALTKEEMRLRTKEGEAPNTEHVSVWFRYPVKRMVITQRFPRSHLPKNVD